MVDISKCSNDLCPRKLDCYRYVAPDGFWQSYSGFDHKDCEHFIQARTDEKKAYFERRLNHRLQKFKGLKITKEVKEQILQDIELFTAEFYNVIDLKKWHIYQDENDPTMVHVEIDKDWIEMTFSLKPGVEKDGSSK